MEPMNSGARIWTLSEPGCHALYNYVGLCTVTLNHPNLVPELFLFIMLHIIKLKKDSVHPWNVQNWKDKCAYFSGEEDQILDGICNKNKNCED